LDAAESTLSLNWVLAGQRTAAQAAEAEAAAGGLAQERALAQLDISSETAFRFLAVLHAQGLSDLAVAQGADAARAVELTERLYETGQGGIAEWQQAQFDEERATLLQEEAHHDLAVARRQLAAQWGSSEATFSRAAGDWHRLPELPALAELEAGLASSPHLQRFEEEALRLKAAERVAEQNNKTLWTLNGGVRHFALGDDVALVASLTANLPQGRRRSAKARELGAEQNALAAEQAQASNLLHATLFELHAQLAHARHQVARLEAVLLPLLRESLSHYRAGYEQGLYDFPTVRRLEQERWSLERERLELAFEAHRTRIALERLSGLTLPAPAL
jgi:cobalt-zinc-cadmium efflux system outer membrane protein